MQAVISIVTKKVKWLLSNQEKIENIYNFLNPFSLYITSCIYASVLLIH